MPAAFHPDPSSNRRFAPPRTAVIAALAGGIALLVGLVAWRGIDTLTSQLAVAGPSLLLLAPWFLICMSLDAFAWRALLHPFEAPWRRLLFAVWAGTAVNALLPVAQIGGEVLRWRLVQRDAHDRIGIAASLVVDKTLQGMAVAAFSLVGLLLLTRYGGRGLWPVLALMALALFAALYGFYRLQRSGLASRAAQHFNHSRLADWSEGLEQALDARYRNRARLIESVVLRAIARVLMVGEVWLALQLLEQPASLGACVVLQSLGHAVRSAAFLVPAGVGVQEGGFVLLTAALGLGPDVGLALSFAKRIREVAVGVPALLVWQVIEARGLVSAPRQ